MADVLRLFVGATELEYSKATYIKSNDYIVNNAAIEFRPTADVTANSIIDFKKQDGSTTVFSGRVNDLADIDMYVAKVYSNGYELMNVKVEKVYTNISPEDLVKDIVDNFTQNLTFASTVTSGVVIEKYIANAYAVDIIKDMMDVLLWKLRIDETDNVYFEPKSFINNGVSLTNGVNFEATEWREDKTNLFNVVKVIGGFQSFAKEETVSGTGTTFVLSEKPNGTLRAVVSGVEQDPTTYTVDAENKTIEFDASQTNPTFFYEYQLPIVVTSQDDQSIADIGYEIQRDIQAPWLDTFSDTRLYASQLLNAFSTPLPKVSGFQPELNFDVDVNEIITVIDPVRGRSAELVITEIRYDGATGRTTYQFGDRQFLLYDWQREVETRVKNLERRFTNVSELNVARTTKTFIRTDIKRKTLIEEERTASDVNGKFSIWDHPTANWDDPDLTWDAVVFGAWNEVYRDDA